MAGLNGNSPRILLRAPDTALTAPLTALLMPEVRPSMSERPELTSRPPRSPSAPTSLLGMEATKLTADSNPALMPPRKPLPADAALEARLPTSDPAEATTLENQPATRPGSCEMNDPMVERKPLPADAALAPSSPVKPAALRMTSENHPANRPGSCDRLVAMLSRRLEPACKPLAARSLANCVPWATPSSMKPLSLAGMAEPMEAMPPAMPFTIVMPRLTHWKATKASHAACAIWGMFATNVGMALTRPWPMARMIFRPTPSSVVTAPLMPLAKSDTICGAFSMKVGRPPMSPCTTPSTSSPPISASSGSPVLNPAANCPSASRPELRSCGTDSLRPPATLDTISRPRSRKADGSVRASLAMSMASPMDESICDESTPGRLMPTPASAVCAMPHAVASACDTTGASTSPSPAMTAGKAWMMPWPIWATRGATFVATEPTDSSSCVVIWVKSTSSRPRAVRKFSHEAFAMPMEPEMVVAASWAVVPVTPMFSCTVWMASTMSA